MAGVGASPELFSPCLARWGGPFLKRPTSSRLAAAGQGRRRIQEAKRHEQSNVFCRVGLARFSVAVLVKIADAEERRGAFF